jgi:hypothetical protein
MNNLAEFTKFWKQNLSHYGVNPSNAIADISIAWAKQVLMEDKIPDEDSFHGWWQERGYEYADRPATATVQVCQAWARYVLGKAHYEPKPLIHLRKGLNESYRSWLNRHGIPFPPVEEERLISCKYVQFRGDLYAEVENGNYPMWFYYLPSERRWQKSTYGPH